VTLSISSSADLAATLADQREDGDIAGGVAGQHGQQGGLADPGSGEQAEALAPPAGGEGVEHAHPEIEPLAQPGAPCGWRRGGADGHQRRPVRQLAAPVQGAAERVDDAADPAVGDRERRALGRSRGGHGGQRGAAGAESLCRPVGHGLREPAAEADDFGRHVMAVATAQRDPVADREVVRQAADLDGETGDAGDAALQPDRRQVVQGGQGGAAALGQGSVSH
jgi:hypothetical protein